MPAEDFAALLSASSFRKASRPAYVPERLRSATCLALKPVAIEECNVDAPAEVVVFERDLVGFVKQIRVEHNRAIGPIGNLHGLRIDLPEPLEDLWLIARTVVVSKVPRSWGFLVVHD